MEFWIRVIMHEKRHTTNLTGIVIGILLVNHHLSREYPGVVPWSRYLIGM